MERVFLLLFIAACAAQPPVRVPASGEVGVVVLRVSEDGRSLDVQRATDEDVQRVDVFARCGPPKIGDPRIRIFGLGGSLVDVTFGKHCEAEVSLSDLSVVRCRCD
jgi:hypothetical protein